VTVPDLAFGAREAVLDRGVEWFHDFPNVAVKMLVVSAN
jgi:hypothetical protein